MDGTAFAAGQRLKTGDIPDGGEPARRQWRHWCGRRQDGFSNLVLDAELKRQQLEGRDKALPAPSFTRCWNIGARWTHPCASSCPRGLAKLDAPVREILRASWRRTRYMQVPVSAAVNEAVKLTRTFKKNPAHPGLVNAVLRKACSYDLSTASLKTKWNGSRCLALPGRDVAEFLCTKTTRTKHWISLPTRPTADDQPAGEPAKQCR